MKEQFTTTEEICSLIFLGILAAASIAFTLYQLAKVTDIYNEQDTNDEDHDTW